MHILWPGQIVDLLWHFYHISTLVQPNVIMMLPNKDVQKVSFDQQMLVYGIGVRNQEPISL
jgi:hypothetical protein